MKKEVTLLTLGNGAAVEKFGIELGRVLKNIADPNAVQTATREITLKVTIKPDQQGRIAAVNISTSAKLAPDAPHPTQMFMDGQGKALTGDPRQTTIFDNDVETSNEGSGT